MAMCFSGKSKAIIILLFLVYATGTDASDPHVLALRLQVIDQHFYYTSKGQISLETGKDINIQVIGVGLTEGTHIKLTTDKREFGANCDKRNLSTPVLETAEIILQPKGMLALDSNDIVYSNSQSIYYVCLRVNEIFAHQGVGNEVTIELRSSSPLPIWAGLVILLTLLSLSGLFSGIQIALMSLHETEFQILMESGSPTEKRNASIILPVRKQGNLLCCSLIIPKVLVNILIPILIAQLPGSNLLVTVMCSTTCILVFGELVPQADCSIHGLTGAAKTILLVKLIMGLTFPLSWPISKVLDNILKREIATVHSKYRVFYLMGLTKSDTDLETQEVN